MTMGTIARTGAKKDVTASLKNLGNIKRKPFNPLALVDLFIEGDKMLEPAAIESIKTCEDKSIHPTLRLNDVS